MANASTSRFDGDLDAQSPAADLVRVYLNGIGKTALLNAAGKLNSRSGSKPGSTPSTCSKRVSASGRTVNAI